jgi:hypothetical protein
MTVHQNEWTRRPSAAFSAITTPIQAEIVDLMADGRERTASDMLYKLADGLTAKDIKGELHNLVAARILKSDGKIEGITIYRMAGAGQ